MRFLADESCDHRVVLALRAAGHDLVAIAEDSPGLPDREVLARSRREARICLVEDRDFGWLIFAAGEAAGTGVFLIRCPEGDRERLPVAIVAEVQRLGQDLLGSFTVWTPDRTRVTRRPTPS